MDTWFVFALASVLLFAIGLQEVLARPGVLRIVIAVNVMGSATLLLLVSLAHRDPAGPDPVPHALALTGIVITLAATAAGLALARGLYRLREGHSHGRAGDGGGTRGGGTRGGGTVDGGTEGGVSPGGGTGGGGVVDDAGEGNRAAVGRAVR